MLMHTVDNDLYSRSNADDNDPSLDYAKVCTDLCTSNDGHVTKDETLEGSTVSSAASRNSPTRHARFMQWRLNTFATVTFRDQAVRITTFIAWWYVRRRLPQKEQDLLLRHYGLQLLLLNVARQLLEMRLPPWLVTNCKVLGLDDVRLAQLREHVAMVAFCIMGWLVAPALFRDCFLVADWPTAILLYALLHCFVWRLCEETVPLLRASRARLMALISVCCLIASSLWVPSGRCDFQAASVPSLKEECVARPAHIWRREVQASPVLALANMVCQVAMLLVELLASAVLPDTSTQPATGRVHKQAEGWTRSVGNTTYLRFCVAVLLGDCLLQHALSVLQTVAKQEQAQRRAFAHASLLAAGNAERQK